jgi:hypothetical protein
VNKFRIIATVPVLACLLGCGGCGLTPSKDDAPLVVADEESGVIMAQLYQPGAPDLLLGTDNQFSYACKEKDLFFADRAEPTDRLVLSVVGGKYTVCYEATPKTVKKDFPTPEKLKAFLASQATGGKPSPYDAAADLFEYVAKFHHSGKTAVMVFAPMTNDSPDPAKSRARLVEAMREYWRKPGGYFCIYGVTWDNVKEVEAVIKEATGSAAGRIVPDVRRDPVRKHFN